jgi:excisionase family DNA binding protein
MENDMPDLWDDARLADYLGVGERFIRRICSDGRIRYLRVGGRRRFDPADVAEYIDREKRGAPSSTSRRSPGRPMNSDRLAG